MTQTWDDLLFAHWEVSADILRPHIPHELTLDLYEGRAWLAIVPFGMSGIRMRGLPSIPGTSAFLEINVRTYVTHKGKPGVYFFSLDAAHFLAVKAARAFFHLPYFHAKMRLKRQADRIDYESVRTHTGAPSAEFRGSYRPVSEPAPSPSGTLESWLTERYCLYTVHLGQLYRGEIHHLPWPLQRAEANITRNTMADPLGISLSDPPHLLHYAHTLKVLLWPLVRCSS